MEDAEYRKLAAVEDRMWYFRALHELVAQALGRIPGGEADILDAGCGTGGLIRRLAARRPGWRWTGVDNSPLACSFARERTGADIREASVEELPFGDCSFDAVVSADVLYHVDDDAQALRESFRVLRPGGLIVVNVPAYRWLWSYHDRAVHARRRYGRSEIVDCLRRAGFVRVRATPWNTLAFPLVVVRRKLLPPPGGGSDVRSYPAVAEAIGRAMAAVERAWIGAGMRLPFGSSIFAEARKP